MNPLEPTQNTESNTPEPPQSVPQPVFQQTTPPDSNISLVPTPAPSPTTTDAPVAEQWQTKESYSSMAEASIAVQPAVGVNKIIRALLYALGAFVLIFVLASSTPIGELFSTSIIDGRSGNTVTSHPLVGISLVAIVACYFLILCFVIAKRVKEREQKSGVITLLVLSAVLLFNPLSFFILLYTVSCNLSPCQSS